MHRLMQRAERFLKPLFWLALVFTFYEAVAPVTRAVHLTWWDKLDHMIAFAVLMLLASVAYRHTALPRLGLGLAGFGVLIEAAQAIPATGRDASAADVLADCIAIMLAAVVAFALRRYVLPRILPEE